MFARVLKWYFLFLMSMAAEWSYADWYYYLYKIECKNEVLRIVDYSAENQEGELRGNEPGVIAAEKLGVWEIDQFGDRVLVKSKSHVEECTIPSGTYKVTIKTGGGNPAWGIWIVHDVEAGKKIFHKNMTDLYNKKKELIFSIDYPEGKLLEE